MGQIVLSIVLKLWTAFGKFYEFEENIGSDELEGLDGGFGGF
jgi:hypothetical protein